MATPILLPRQGQSVESCIITDIYVSVGDIVKAGTPLFAYETDKASFEESAIEDGKILALFFKAGDEVPVLTNIGVIGQEGEPFDEFLPGGNATTESAGTQKVPSSAADVIEHQNIKKEEPSPGDVFISPRARNLAVKEGVSPEAVKGTGPKGRIIEADILKAIAKQPKMTPLAKHMSREEGRKAGDEGSGLGQMVRSKDLVAGNSVYSDDNQIVPLTNIRKLIAKAMLRSIQNSAQLTHHMGADARRILEIRQKVKNAQKDGYQFNITLNDMICAGVIRALRDFPNANSHFLGDSMRVFNKVHLGLAVDTDRGLMVPVIKNADDLSLTGLSSQMKGLADSCRRGNIDPDLLAPEAASFTISNLGNYGIEVFTPVINLPQVAILGVNAILPRPKDLGNGMYGFVPHLGLSLSYDHQALDGGEASRFLKAIATEIENFYFEL